MGNRLLVNEALMMLSRNVKIIILIVLCLIALPAMLPYVPVGLDWRDAYRPAALAMLRGESPYDVDAPTGFYNAPWALIPFLPFAIMPYQIGRVGVFIMGLVGFAFVAYRLNAKPVSILIFLTSASVIGCLNNGNLDWLPMLAFVLPARSGLFFAFMKPQVGIGICIYWIFESWRDGGVRMVIRNFAPAAVLLGISFLFYGFWIMRFVGMESNINNMSIFPYGVLPGLYLLWLSIKKQDARPAMAVGPLIAPYVSQFSYAAVLAALMDRPKWLAFISGVLWIPVILRVIA
jgi:hypothetical protein